ncbi:MAG: DNA repair protein RecO [Spirochaetota bacterium]
MEIQKATGIILSSREFGEADYICTIFTKEFGKRDFVFKGLRKSRKRPQLVSEPGTTAKIIYYFHDDKLSYIVNEYQILNHNIDIRNNLKNIYLLYYMLALVEKTTGYNDRNVSIFNLAAAGIENISLNDFPEHFSVFFTLHLLKLHGILPDFQRCKLCGNADSTLYIDTTDFHPVCGKCFGSCQGRTIHLKKNTKEYLLKSLACKFASIDHSLFKSEHIIDLLFAITLFIENYYHVEIKPKHLLINELSC